MCLQLFTKTHKCYAESDSTWYGTFHCTVCGINLHKETKKREINGQVLYRHGYKKYYRLINSLVCYQCVCNLIKLMKHEKRTTVKGRA